MILILFTDIAIINRLTSLSRKGPDDIEVISLFNNSVHTKISQFREVIPPNGFCGFGGTRLPNGYFLFCDEYTEPIEIHESQLFKDGFIKWERVLVTKMLRLQDPSYTKMNLNHHVRGFKSGNERFSFVRSNKKVKKDMTINIFEAAKAMVDNDKMLISGGNIFSGNHKVSNQFISLKQGLPDLLF